MNDLSTQDIYFFFNESWSSVSFSLWPFSDSLTWAGTWLFVYVLTWSLLSCGGSLFICFFSLFLLTSLVKDWYFPRSKFSFYLFSLFFFYILFHWFLFCSLLVIFFCSLLLALCLIYSLLSSFLRYALRFLPQSFYLSFFSTLGS